MPNSCSLSTDLVLLFPNIGTKYDLDSKSANKSGQNFKAGEDMIAMYKELCAGIKHLIKMPVMFVAYYFIGSMCSRG